ncbi:hypothetical protein HanPI659440_Chr05g0205601 [Helianthus annuus]|nr:hypothetical protein HanPI659440_Chr05g0205601 [Helianthus annuus]
MFHISTSQSIAASLQSRVVNAERLLTEKEGVESLVKDREVGWRKERETLLAHQEKREAGG